MKLVTVYENFALASFLTAWPEDTSYEEVLMMIENNSPDVDIWEPFENHAREFVIEQIRNMKEALEFKFVEK